MTDSIALSSTGYYRQLRQAGMSAKRAESRVCQQYGHRDGETRTAVLLDLLRRVEADLPAK